MKRTVQVSGAGRAEAQPDVVRLVVTASAVRESMREASEAAASAGARVRAELESAGITGADAATQAVRFEPEWRAEGQPQRYAARQTIAVASRDVPGAGALVTAIVEAGGDDVLIESVTFDVAHPAALAVAAREAAWADAVAKAEQFAALAGTTLGPVAAIAEGVGHGPVPLARLAKLESADAAQQPLEAGGVAVEAAVTVTWELA